MRLLRIPYYYLDISEVREIYSSSIKILNVVADIHHNRPNLYWAMPSTKHYMYHASFLRWCFYKSKMELIENRGAKCVHQLSDEHLKLKSKPLSEFVPPNEQEIAEDVVWLLEKWKQCLPKDDRRLPQSYVRIAEIIYGYTVEGTVVSRIDQSEGRHRDNDRGWFDV